MHLRPPPQRAPTKSKLENARNFSVRRLDAMDPGILENLNMDFGTNMRRLTGSLGGLGANKSYKTHTAFSV